jgi:predicted nucleic acid-binding protein
MAKVYVDSNVFFYAKIKDRVYGQSCSNILRSIVAGKLEAAVSTLVPIEVANALRKFGLQREVATEVHAICSLTIDIYTIDLADAREAAEIYKEVGISPYDCLHAAIMRNHDLKEIVSADNDFDKIKWLERKDPRSISSAR